MSEQPKQLIVKALGPKGGFYGYSRKRPGVKFVIAKLEHYSHQWMQAVNFEAPPPSPKVKKIIEAPQFQARFKKYVPFDKKTAPKLKDETLVVEEPGDQPEAEGDVVVDLPQPEPVAAASKAKGKGKGKAKAKKAEAPAAEAAPQTESVL